MGKSPPTGVSPRSILDQAIKAVPAMKYALGVAGLAAVVAIVLLLWQVNATQAVLGSVVVLVLMGALVVFAALAKTGTRALRTLALFMAWSFVGLTVASAVLLLVSAFWHYPRPLSELLGPPTTKVPEATAFAEAILDDAYAGDYQSLYRKLAEGVKGTYSVAATRSILESQFSQFSTGPISRKLRAIDRQPSFTVVMFDAEFDGVDNWIETVTLVLSNDQLKLYQFGVLPTKFVEQGASLPQLSQSTIEALRTFLADGGAESEVENRWIPASGWKQAVSQVLTQRTDRSCDVEFGVGSTTLIAKSLLGGCSLRVGQVVTLGGRFTGLDGAKLRFEQVRYFS